ncbi:hypothetical protein HIX98_004503 [Salmonella enterica subsp. enterica serovar Bredeney]|nr:hypothetical protein [Salmonella enterica subsp. enterica serovar Bredeney]
MKIQQLLLMVVTFSSQVYGANTYAYLWATKSSFSGSLTYDGPAISTINGKLSSLNTGTMAVTYKECATPDRVYLNYAASDQWLFIPEKISVADREVNLTPSVPAGFANYGRLNGYHIIAQRMGIVSNQLLGSCGQVGNTYPINYTYPEVNLTAIITGLPPGKYQGTIPVRFAYAEYFSTTADIIKFSDALAFQHSSISDIPYSINITNTCTILSKGISLDHGSLTMSTANENTVSEKVSVHCDSAASLKLSLSAVTLPTNKYTDGIGVGLGKDWDTALTVDNTGLSYFSPTKTISASASHELTIRSTLKKTLSSSSGKMQGAAVLLIDIP